MGGGKKKKNENENGRKREFATDPHSKRAREKIRRSGTPLTPIMDLTRLELLDLPRTFEGTSPGLSIFAKKTRDFSTTPRALLSYKLFDSMT